MIYLAFHSPLMLKDWAGSSYSIVMDFSPTGDLSSTDNLLAKLREQTSKTRLFFCDTKTLARAKDHLAVKSALKEFKVIVLDSLTNFSASKATVADGTQTTNIVWKFCKIDKELFPKLIEDLPYGVNGEPMQTITAYTNKENLDITLQCFSVETSSKFGSCIEALVFYSESENQARSLRESFIKYALGFLEEVTFKKYIKTLESKNYFAKLLRQTLKALDSRDVYNLALALVDQRSFPEIDIDTSLTDFSVKKEDYDYISTFLPSLGLTQSKCLYTIEDMDNEILKKRVSGGELIVTDSIFGQSLEKILERRNYAPDNNDIRRLFFQIIQGEIDQKAYSRFLKFYQINDVTAQKVIRQAGAISEVHQEVVKREHPNEKIFSDFKVTSYDYEYFKTLAGI